MQEVGGKRVAEKKNGTCHVILRRLWAQLRMGGKDRTWA